MKTYFEANTRVIFGEGESLKLKSYIKRLGYNSPGIVIDENIYKYEYGKRIISGYQNILHYNFGEPTYILLDQWKDYFIDNDVIVGIGGGSTIDFAKGLAFLSKNKGNAISYRGFPEKINTPTPVITIPTTAGTGSEVTYNAVFIDSIEKRKFGINTKLNYPILSILDPLLIITCPKIVMISSGLDALIHCIEGHYTTVSTPLSKSISREAFRFLYPNLNKISDDEINIDIISNMMFGAYLSGITLINSGAGPAGGLGYILGAKFNIPHGIAGAIFLPHIIKFNEEKGIRYTDLFNGSLSADLFRLYDKFNINYLSLKQFGVNEKNIYMLLNDLPLLIGVFNMNPVKYDIEDAKILIRSLI